MIDHSHRGKGVFYGLWIVAGCFVLLFLFAGAGFYSFSIFIKPLENDFGWSRSAISLAMSIYMIVHGLAGPFVGHATETYGPTRVMTLFALLSGAAFILVSFTSSLWFFYLAYGVLSVGTAGIGFIPVSSVLSRWFIRRRGTAIGFAMVGISVGGLVMAPLVGWIISQFGWRASFIFLGLLVWLLGLPVTLFVIKASPAEMGLMPDGDEAGEAQNPYSAPGQSGSRAAPAQVASSVAPARAAPSLAPAQSGSRVARAQVASSVGSAQASSPVAPAQVGSPMPPEAEGWPLRAAVRTRAFFWIAATFYLASLALMGMLQHQVPLIVEAGISQTLAATALGLTAGLGGLGKLFFGRISELVPFRYAITLCFGLQALGVLVLLNVESIAMVWVYVAIFGFAMGGVIVLLPLAVAHFFGLASFGVIMGSVSFVQALGNASGALISGLIYDFLGSYHYAMLAYMFLYVIATLSIFLAGKPKLYFANSGGAGLTS
jgi:MFS transporter, OFA family, oxalate/formate antiporter